MVLTTNMEKVVKHAADYQAYGKSINQEQQQVVLRQASRYLVSHMAEMHGNWPVAF